MAASIVGSGDPSAREHVERIRRDRFFIGREEKNPLAEDMHQAVNYLSEELYSKDVHFLMELIQVYLYSLGPMSIRFKLSLMDSIVVRSALRSMRIHIKANAH
jgi:sacsin